MTSRKRKRRSKPSPTLPARMALAVLGVDHAAQDFSLPVGLVDGPALDGPAVFADDARAAVVIDVVLTRLLRRFELATDAPGVALAARDLFIVDHRDDARFRQVQQTQGDH